MDLYLTHKCLHTVSQKWKPNVHFSKCRIKPLALQQQQLKRWTETADKHFWMKRSLEHWEIMVELKTQTQPCSVALISKYSIQTQKPVVLRCKTGKQKEKTKTTYNILLHLHQRQSAKQKTKNVLWCKCSNKRHANDGGTPSISIKMHRDVTRDGEHVAKCCR